MVSQRVPAAVIAVLLAAVLAIGLTARLGPHAGTTPVATPVRTADLVMHDETDGSVEVVNTDGSAVAIVPPASNGFLRVLLAGLVRERRREGMGAPGIPFRITRWSDGRLTLDDAATGKLIELDAFGTDNAGAFARLLDLARP